MVNIMCAPLYVYDTEAHLDEKIGGGEEAWWVKMGYDSDTEISVIWVYISYLRKKLTALRADVQIRAVRDAGYVLEEIS